MSIDEHLKLSHSVNNPLTPTDINLLPLQRLFFTVQTYKYHHALSAQAPLLQHIEQAYEDFYGVCLVI